VRDETGQTTAEYAALLALVAAAFVGGGAAIGLGEVANAVATSVRTGICIVAGDVCRASDAAAAGLTPCTVSETTYGEGLTVTVLSVRLGADERWTAATRSDGTVTVTQTDERTIGGTVGIGLEASPLGVDVGGSGKLDYRFGGGRAWEFPDMAAALRFVRGDHDAVEPVWRFGGAGTVLAGQAAGGVAGIEVTGLEATAEAAAGVRVGRGRTTYYVRSRVDGFDGRLWTPGGTARLEGPGPRETVVELTRDGGGLRELAFRAVGSGARTGQIVETVARLDLRDPADRAAAEPLLSLRLPWPPAAARELAVLTRRAVRSGIVERAVYEVRDDSDDVKLAAEVGVAVGLDAREVDVERRLVAASAWTGGGRERDRADCGVTATALERTS
jgi:Flp pilus assembly pilin Flp